MKHARLIADITVLVIVTLIGLILGALVGSHVPAHAEQVEPADRQVKTVWVTYAEPMFTKKYPNRHYFETNDGAAYRYKGNAACERDNAVPNRVCHTVFWYAR